MSCLRRIQRFLLLACFLCSALLQARPVSLEVVQEFGSDPYGPLLQVGDHIVAAGFAKAPYAGRQEFSGLLDILKFEQNKFSLVGQTDIAKLLPAEANVTIKAIAAYKDYVYLLVSGSVSVNVNAAVLTLRLEDNQFKLLNVTNSDLFYHLDVKTHIDPAGMLYVTVPDVHAKSLSLQSFALQSDGTPKQVATKAITQIDPAGYHDIAYHASWHDKSLLITLNNTTSSLQLADRVLQVTLSAQGLVADILPLKLSQIQTSYSFSHFNGDFLYLHSWRKGLQVFQKQGDDLILVDETFAISQPDTVFSRAGYLFFSNLWGIQRVLQDSQGKLTVLDTINPGGWLSGGTIVTPAHLVVSQRFSGIAALRFDGNQLAYDANSHYKPKDPVVFNQSSASQGLIKIGHSLIDASMAELAVWQQDPQTQRWQLEKTDRNPASVTPFRHLAVAAVNDRLLSSANGSLVSYDTKLLPRLSAGTFIYRLNSNELQQGKLQKLSQGYLFSDPGQLVFFDDQDNFRFRSPMSTWVAERESYEAFGTVAGQHVYLTINGNYSTDGYTSKIKILSAEDLNNVRQVGEIALKDASVITNLLIKDNLLLVLKNQHRAYFSDSKLDIYDIADVSRISLISSTRLDFGGGFSTGLPTGMQWIDNYLLLLQQHTTIYDMSNPAAPVWLGAQANFGSNGQFNVLGGELFNVQYNHLGRFQQLRLNYAPTAKDLTLQVAKSGIVQHQLQGTDPENDQITFAVATAPQHGTLTITDGQFLQYEPKVGFVGKDTASLRVQDKLGGSKAFSLAIEVIASNQAPVVKKLFLTTSQNQPVSARLNASDPDGDALTYQIVTEAANGTADISAQGQIQFKPRWGFFGNDAFTIRISDGQLTVDTIVDVEVDAGWSWFD